jgi:membrane protein implicated in regulation of membrane protease activity
MGARIAARIIFLILALAMVWIGVGFAAFAIAAGLTPHVGMAWGAAIAAAVLLAPALLAAIYFSVRRPPKRGLEGIEGAMIALVSSIVNDKPIMAILGAGLAAAFASLLNRKRK